MKNKILYSIFIFAQFGCIEEIPVENIAYSEKLVVNELFSNNEPFSIQISNSKNAYKEPNPIVLDSTQVSVTLFEDNKPVKLIYDAFANIYYSQVKPVTGKSYQLFVLSKFNKYTSVSAIGNLPEKLKSKNSSFIEDGGIDMQGNTSDLLKLTFLDDANSKDHYKLNFFYYSELIDKFTAFDFELNGILASVTTIKSRDGGFLFSDETFNGQQQTVTAVPPFGLVKGNTTYKYLIQIQRISEDYWKYSSTLEQYRGGLSGGGGGGGGVFNGAVVVYTNVLNGLGIFAGANVEGDTLK